jgi:hypothetical protein
MTEEQNDQSVIDFTTLDNIYDEIDRSVATNAVLLGDRLAGMSAESIYHAIGRSQALKKLATDDREKIENKALHLWSLATVNKINESNQSFNKWVLPVAGIVSLVLMIGFFVPDHTGKEVKDNGNAVAKVRYTEWLK